MRVFAGPGHKIRSTVQDKARKSLSKLFDTSNPLENTLDYPGQEGFCGPKSVSWRVIGDVSAFVGGIRALIVQACHPEVVAGVVDHSKFRQDPLGRLGRTSAYVTATTFGSNQEAKKAVEKVYTAHKQVKGISSRKRPYCASDPDLAAWVHNALTESFLSAYQAFGPRPLSHSDTNKFVTEQAAIGSLLGANPLPETYTELKNWIVTNNDAQASPDLFVAIDFLKRPPLPNKIFTIVYKILLWGAISTLDPRWQNYIGFKQNKIKYMSSMFLCKALIKILRFVLGPQGPSYEIASKRVASQV